MGMKAERLLLKCPRCGEWPMVAHEEHLVGIPQAGDPNLSAFRWPIVMKSTLWCSSTEMTAADSSHQNRRAQSR